MKNAKLKTEKFLNGKTTKMVKIWKKCKNKARKQKPLQQMRNQDRHKQVQHQKHQRKLKQKCKTKNSSKMQNVLNLHKSQTPTMRPLNHNIEITETNAQLTSTITSRALKIQ